LETAAAQRPPWGDIPEEVIDWARAAFASCNEDVTATLSRVPNIAEEALDLRFIAKLSEFAIPRVLGGGWTVQIDTHFLGGGHHLGTWEVADIGIIVRVRDPAGVRSRKVALLQSKRLYPIRGTVREETASDYLTGMARLDDPEDELVSIARRRTFTFTSSSRYRQLDRRGHQIGAIDNYERNAGLRVYYHLYNPWQVPYRQQVPLVEYVRHDGPPELGARVVPAASVHGVLGTVKHREPSLGDIGEIADVPRYGWPLESFVAEELLRCREGDVVPDRSDTRLRRLFGERTGPIAAAIAITIEAPVALAEAGVGG
jgi:hypothetical protein